jgi:hypothetical protein
MRSRLMELSPCPGHLTQIRSLATTCTGLRIGCPLCSTRPLAGTEELPVFRSPGDLRAHFATVHWRRLQLSPPFPPVPVPAVRAQECDGLTATLRDAGHVTCRVLVNSRPPWRPVNCTYSGARATDRYVANARLASESRATHCAFVDVANVPALFHALQGVDPSAEVTVSQSDMMFVCVCEPCVDVFRDIGSVPYARTMLESSRLFVHRSHGGSEAGDLVIADLIARMACASQCNSVPLVVRDGDIAGDTGVENHASASLVIHLVGNDRRLAKCLKAAEGLTTPIIEHHAFSKSDREWRCAMVEMLALAMR